MGDFTIREVVREFNRGFNIFIPSLTTLVRSPINLGKQRCLLVEKKVSNGVKYIIDNLVVCGGHFWEYPQEGLRTFHCNRIDNLDEVVLTQMGQIHLRNQVSALTFIKGFNE